jgi:hypothetical protein
VILSVPADRNLGYSARGELVGTWQSSVCAALALVGVAAAAGTLRFAGIAVVRPIHEFLAALAMYVSMPMIGLASVLAYSSLASRTIPVSVFIGLVSVFFAFRQFPRQLKQHEESYVLLTSLFGVLCALFRSLFILLGRSGSSSADSHTAAWYGLAGTGLVMVAGAVTTKGVRRFGPISVKNVDVFHCQLQRGDMREASEDRAEVCAFLEHIDADGGFISAAVVSPFSLVSLSAPLPDVMAIANICLVHLFLGMWR